eukprot:TRINITY_DN1263_c0_g1_i1.p1 TRINITY_DN1263_c0_g1~~TRINITY_DN1263_c0_g1_i1.p1  ORF type:complete len:1351 (+),score=429.52 TRINITY_DN1263_c0_g1_i1:1374-5426(+)
MKLRPSDFGTFHYRGGCEKYLHEVTKNSEQHGRKVADRSQQEHMERGNAFEASVVEALRAGGEKVVDATKNSEQHGRKVADRSQQEHMERGNAFEASVVEALRAGGEKVVDATNVQPFKVGDGRLAQYLMDNAVDGVMYIAQLPLAATQVGSVGSDVQLSRAFPDLVRVAKEGVHITLTIIDIKASDRMKVSHQAQIAAYHWIMTKHLKGSHITISNEGEIWRATQPHEHATGPHIAEKADLSVMQSQVRRVLKKMLEPPEEVSWVLNPVTCNGCEYLHMCKEEARASLKSLKDMTPEKLDVIKEATKTSDIEQLSEWWGRTKGDDPAKAQVASLLRCSVEDKEIPMVRSLLEGCSEITGAPYMIPEIAGPSEVMLGLVPDIKASAVKMLAVGTQSGICLLQNPTMDDVVGKLVQVLDEAEGGVQFFITTEQERKHVLQQLLQWAVAHPTNKGLERCLLHLADHHLLAKAGYYTDILQGLDAMLSIKKASKLDDFKNVCKRLGLDTASPTGKPSKLLYAKRVAKHVLGYEPEGDEVAVVQQALSKLADTVQLASKRFVPLEAVLKQTLYWPDAGMTTMTDICKHMEVPLAADVVDLDEEGARDRVAHGFEMLAWLRNRLKGAGVLKGAPCESAPPAMWGKGVVSELLYDKQADTLLTIKEVAAARPCIVLETVAAGKGVGFRVLEGEQYIINENFMMGNWLLSPSPPPTEEGAITSHTFPDLRYCCTSALSTKSWEMLRGVTLCDIDTKETPCKNTSLRQLFSKDDETIGWVTVYKLGNHSSWLDWQNMPTGARFTLHKRHLDVNLPKVMCALQAAEDTLFTNLLDRKACMTHKPGPSHPLDEQEGLCAMTDTQENAFAHSLTHAVQLVWGPPGTGKTYYLACAIVRWMEAALLSGAKSYHVLVSSVAKLAFNEVILQVKRQAEQRRVVDERWGEVLVGVLEGEHWYASEPPKDVSTRSWSRSKSRQEGALPDALPETQTPHELSGRAPSPPFREVIERAPLSGKVNFSVIGCTTWRLMAKAKFTKAPDDGQSDERDYEVPSTYDAVVIDEASQMPTTDASTLVNKVNPETGRLVLAGDHLQLPPISQTHKGAEDTGSVFQTLMKLRDRDTVMLKENLRSNVTINSLSQRLYSEEYRATQNSDAVLVGRPEAMKVLARWDVTGLLSTNDRWRDGLLTVVVDGGRNYGPVEEAEVCASVADSIRSISVNRHGEEYTASACSPTRLQRDALNNQISSCKRTLFDKAETVNKMQGQTADAVFVAYSVPSFKTDFFYDLTRLNVAFSRARSLCVLFVSQPVLEPPYTISDEALSRQGFTHLLAFVERSQVLQLTLRNGEVTGEWGAPSYLRDTC